MHELLKVKKSIDKDINKLTRVVVFLIAFTGLEIVVSILMALNYLDKGNDILVCLCLCFILLATCISINFHIYMWVHEYMMRRLFRLMRGLQDDIIYDEVVRYIEKVWKL